MGHWSIFSSVDYCEEHSNYDVPMPPAEALHAAAAVIAIPDRVVVSGQGDTVIGETIKHTPAWVLATWLFPPLGLILTFAVRRSRVVHITATTRDGAATLHARGKLDTTAATRLRNLRAA